MLNKDKDLQKNIRSHEIYNQHKEYIINRESETSLKTQQNDNGFVNERQNKFAEETKITQANSTIVKPFRLKSLDIYRGLTMVGMILVDNMGPEGGPWWLDHPQWDGFTPADLIFPSFLFIMGMAISFSLSSSRPLRLKNILRIIALFGIGVLLNIYSRKADFANVRIMGILQRLALCYGIIVFLHWGICYGKNIKTGAGIVVGAVAAYVIGVGFYRQCGDLIQNNLSIQCNLIGYVDRIILTLPHIWRHRFTDPEGILSTINAAATTYVGYIFGILYLRKKEQLKNQRSEEAYLRQNISLESPLVQHSIINNSNWKQLPLKEWMIFSLILAAGIYPSLWFMPLNKQLYSLSFLFTVSSVSGLTLVFFAILIDACPSNEIINWITAPLKWLGMNPLLVFVLMSFMAITLIYYIEIGSTNAWNAFYRTCFLPLSTTTQVKGVLFATFFVFAYTFIAGIMYKFKIFLRV